MIVKSDVAGGLLAAMQGGFLPNLAISTKPAVSRQSELNWTATLIRYSINLFPG